MALKEIDLGNVRGPVGSTGAKGVSMRLKGAWSSSTAYVNDGSYIDLVTSGGNTYACKKSNTNQAVSNSTYWELIAQKGATGPQGQPGLTDAERKLIQAWEIFKASGGDIGGVITTLGMNGPSSCAYAFGNGNLQLKNGEARIDFIAGDGSKPPRLEPLTGRDYDLGDPNYHFKDVWIGPCSKSTNGHTKLPNGMIMQWGTVAGSMSNGFKQLWVNFPITFPNTCHAVICTPKTSGGYDLSGLLVETDFNSIGLNFNIRQILGNVGNHAFQATWIAIGY